MEQKRGSQGRKINTQSSNHINKDTSKPQSEQDEIDRLMAQYVQHNTDQSNASNPIHQFLPNVESLLNHDKKALLEEELKNWWY